MRATTFEQSTKLFGEYKSPSTGTESYYKLNLFTSDKLLMTDGVKEMFRELSCYWLGDIIVSYYPKFARLGQDFMTCQIIKDMEGTGCEFVMTDGNENKLISQRIEFTDLQKNVKIFLQSDGERFILMCPSEY